MFDRASKAFHWSWQLMLRALSPWACVYCKAFLKQNDVFCTACFLKLKPVVSFMLPVTTTRSVKIFAACAYQEPIKTVIVAKSWSDHCASKQLAQLIWQMTDIKNIPCDYIIPIPLHWTRYAKRGFNQAYEMGKCVSSKNNAPVADILKRIKRTPFQSKVIFKQRLENVQDAFELKNIDAELYKGKHLMIVDDLMTTGSTIKAAAKILFQLKPASINVVVASRVMPN
jgi:ComF family protein